jgi:hypothetical protein
LPKNLAELVLQAAQLLDLVKAVLRRRRRRMLLEEVHRRKGRRPRSPAVDLLLLARLLATSRRKRRIRVLLFSDIFMDSRVGRLLLVLARKSTPLC